MVDHTNIDEVAAGRHGPSVSASFLGDFAHYLHDEAKVPSAGTIRSYCQQVAALCEDLHLPRPTIPPLLDRALDRETAAHPVDRAKHPASPALMAAFVHDQAIPMVLRVAAVLLWFTTLRGTEVLATSPTHVKDLCLRRQDVSFAPDGSFIRLAFRRGKPFARNQPNIRVLVRPGPDQPDALDPVAFVLEYVRTTQSHSDAEPFLRHADGALATKRHLLDAIKRKARALGLNDADYAVHSFRSGGVTTMRAHGVADADIQAQGGWLSEGGDAPYRRPNVQQSQRAQHALAVPAQGQPSSLLEGVQMVTSSTPLLSPSAALLALPRSPFPR